MPAPDFRKRALVFVAFAGTVTLILMLLPSVEGQMQAYFYNNFGLTITPEGNAVPASGDQPPGMMVSTTIALAVNLLRILRILLWMGLIISVVRFVGQAILSTFRGSQPEVSSLLKTVLSMIIYIVSFFIVFQSQYPEVPLAPLFTGSTILGIVVGLALQDTLGNLFAGIALQADQPFQLGDVVTFMNQQRGVVESVSWRGVKIRTFENRVLVVSNSVLGKEMIEVSPRGNLNARIVFFNTEYVNSPSKTLQLVREAVRQIENVSQKLRPVVRIKNLGDNGIDWEIKYWADDYTKHPDTDALIRQRIWYLFNRENIEFAYPTRTIFMEEKKPEPTLVEYANSVGESLQQVPMFVPLGDDEIEKLARGSSTRVYAPGEAIVRRGQEGNSMFVIVRGKVAVQIPEGNEKKTIGELTANDFFGEMSLLTGQPRTANVIALEETEVIQIKKTSMRSLFEANPDLMQAICAIIEERREVLVQQAEQEDDTVAAQSGVLSSLRRFFGFSKSDQ
ncbi:MAG TPA: mechanosensitive ion channel family protein [Pyrinomonadaceae bacterium]|nr:mechanosensitive ion channel family protein [Pyrinomonadaceae bacterium]